MVLGTIRCPICGAVNAAEARRCVSCWGELGPVQGERPADQRERRRRHTPYVPLALAFVAGLVVVWAIAGALAPRYPRTVRTGLVDLTVTGYETRADLRLDGATPSPTDAPYQTILVALTLKNHGDRPRRLDPPTQMMVVDRDGQIYRALPRWRDAELPDTIPPGGQVSGQVAFRVPAGTPNLRLVVTVERAFKPGEIPLH